MRREVLGFHRVIFTPLGLYVQERASPKGLPDAMSFCLSLSILALSPVKLPRCLPVNASPLAKPQQLKFAKGGFAQRHSIQRTW